MDQSNPLKGRAGGVKPHYNPPHPRDCPVLLLDALGFRAALRDQKLADVYCRYHNLMATVFATATSFDMSIDLGIYADSVVVVPRAEGSFDKLVILAEALLSNTIIMRAWAGFQLRGAIAVGPMIFEPEHRFRFRVEYDDALGQHQVEELPCMLVLGQALADAYDWEQKQKWIGASISPDARSIIKQRYPEAVRRLMDDRYLIDWGIPTENGPVSALAINYVTTKHADSVIQSLQEAESRYTLPDVKAKYTAARAFAEHIDTNGLHNKAYEAD